MIWADETNAYQERLVIRDAVRLRRRRCAVGRFRGAGVRNQGPLSSGAARALLTIIPVHVVAVWSVLWNLKLITRQLVRIEGHPPLPVALAAACLLVQTKFGLAATASQRHDSKLIYMASPLPNDVT
jgi:hypothetical protein